MWTWQFFRRVKYSFAQQTVTDVLIRFEKISNNLCNLKKKRNQERLRERGIGGKN